MKLKVLLASCFLIASYLARAQGQSPHENIKNETGVISGRLLADKKTPLPKQMVVLEIFKGHELVLSIPKQTDAKGKYQFKNIFKSPDFFYAVSTEYKTKLYRTEFVSLGANENELRLDLYVGAGASEALPLPPPPPKENAEEHTHVHKKTLNEYQLLAIVLSVIAVGYAIYRRRKSSVH